MGTDQTCLISVFSLLRAQERQTIYSAAPHPTRVRSIPKLHLNPTSSAVASKELLGTVRTEKASNGIFFHMLLQHPCIYRLGTSQFRFVIFPFNLCLVTTISTKVPYLASLAHEISIALSSLFSKQAGEKGLLDNLVE